MKLGSLFDGSGGFPLGAVLNGIEPVWASEIEPFPVRVTTRRFPNMKHYGNVAEIDGGKVEPVDIITFGSPCQDMSIAGKRAGLDGSRSKLFYEAVRIIKEMRKSTNGIYPRYAIWENVAGAFSSNKGEDFRCVLEAMCRISDEEVYVPSADKWQQAGCILGGHYSIAWRTFDAQYWGVPQRRKRIYLVADFAGERATEILFKSEGVSWHTPKSFQSRQNVARCATDCVGAAIAVENHPNDSRVKLSKDGNVQVECWKLMGLTEIDCAKAIAIGVSDSQLYKQAGNGIVTNCCELLAEHLYKAQYDGTYVCTDEKISFTIT